MKTHFWMFAPAKINLALHVTGQRDDGYHFLETIAIFADIGDRIGLEAAVEDSFLITGPEAAPLLEEYPAQNLVLRARDMVRAVMAENGLPAPPVALTLQKSLPAGSGIGGGSADAAATLRALTAHWNAVPLAEIISTRAVTLGADVPMCLGSAPVFARGVGERLQPMTEIPVLSLVLVNPRVHVSTPAVFAALTHKQNAPVPISDTNELSTALDWAQWLDASTRNDLQLPSAQLNPEIGLCLEALRETEPLIARMSGSGATCFGIYADMDAARSAAATLLRDHGDWWIRETQTGQSHRSEP